MEIILETKQFILDLDGKPDENELFYRYNIDGNLVWFSQEQRSGNIYSVSVRLTEDLEECFDVWVHHDNDWLSFYPNDITIVIKRAKIKIEDIDKVVANMHYINKLCDVIMSIFKTKEHYALWYKHHKDNEHSKHKDHHCMCCGEYIEEEHLKVCDKCASEYKF